MNHRISRGIIAAVFAVAISTWLSGCAFTRIKRFKDVPYTENQKLNVFAPRNKTQPHAVLVYVYGGNWTSGRKGLYSFFGSRWARKGVVTVIPDYPKSPGADYKAMTMDVARSIKWVKENIGQYRGDPDRIFVSGHSAGGQLVALSVMDTSYFQQLGTEDPVKGMILIDPAGLDMYRYLKEVDSGPNGSYLDIFTRDTATWKKASAIFHVHDHMPPILLYTGERTQYTISIGAQRFFDKVKTYDTKIEYRVVKRRKHIPMITQFFNTGNPLYRQIKEFMRKAE